ncbi:MAG TPA: amino acid permease [Pyrinomonadaceae bacterium]|nr:amino acid permease [Pyrinomonadaceae bacterium]
MSTESILIRGLGPVATTAIVVGNVIGTGVFLKSRVMTCNVGTPSRVIAVWIVAGLLSLAGALTYAELAALWPKAGGEYVFIRNAYSARLAFLFGWMRFFASGAGSLAALAVGFAIFLNVLTGALDVKYFTLNLPGYPIPFGRLQIVALGAIAFVTIVNCASVSVGGKFAITLTVIKVGSIVALGVGVLLFARGTWSNFLLADTGGTCEGVAGAARGGSAGFAAAMLGALWAYNGWNEMTFVSGEVKNPQRNIPIALATGMIICMVLYVFVNTTYFYVLTPTQVADVPATSSVAAVAVQTFLGEITIALMAAAMMISTLGALHTSTMANSRIPFAMARDGLFPKPLAHVSERTHVPVRALLVQGMWASVLALSGSYDTLTDYVVFVNWIFFGLVIVSIFFIRRRVPSSEGAYRAWGYPIVPLLFLLTTAWLLVSTLITSPVRSLIGLGLVALGIPVYHYWTLPRPATSQTDSTRSPRTP